MKLKLLNAIDKISFCLTLSLFALIPLYPKFPLFNVKGTYVAVRLEDFFIGLAIGFFLIGLFLRKQWSFFLKTSIGKAFLLFFLIGGLSLFSALFLTHSIQLNLGVLHFARRVELMLLLPLAAVVFNTKKRLKAVLIVLFVTLFIVNVYALGQQYLNWPVISTTNSEFAKGQILRLTPGARVNSTFAGHYDLAVFLAGAFGFLAAFFFALNKRFKIIIFACGILSMFILIMTAARVSFLAAFAGITSVLIFSKKKKYLLLIFIFLLAVLVYPSQLRDRFVSTLTVNILHLGQRYEGRNLNQQLESKLNIPTLSYRMASRSSLSAPFATAEAGIPVDITPGEPIDETQLGVYRSFQIRLNVEWPRAMRALLKNPFFGTGYSSLGIATDNDLLRSLGETGILGTMAFFLILLAVWKKIWKGLKSEEKLIKCFSGATLSLIIVFLINGSFIDVFEASKVATLFWLVLGVNLGVLGFNNK